MPWFPQQSRRTEGLLYDFDTNTGVTNKIKKKTPMTIHIRSKTDKDDLCDATDHWPYENVTKYSPIQGPIPDLYTGSPDWNIVPECSRLCDAGELPSRLIIRSNRSKSRSRKGQKSAHNRRRSLSEQNRTRILSSRTPSPNHRIADKRNLSPNRRVNRTENVGLDMFDIINSNYNKSGVSKKESCKNKLQNLAVENAMLKNELNVANKGVAHLLEQLRATADERQLVEARQGELALREEKLIIMEKKMEETKKKLEDEVSSLKGVKTHYEERIRSLEKLKEEETIKTLNIEKELRLAQTTIEDLKIKEQTYQNECKRIEIDWEGYKVQVKDILEANETEIEQAKEKINLTEDTKILIEIIDDLNKQRDDLENVKIILLKDIKYQKGRIKELEMRLATAEKLFTGIKYALVDERNAKQEAQKACTMLHKAMLSAQEGFCEETNRLQTSLLEREDELRRAFQILNRLKKYAYAERNDSESQEVSTIIQNFLTSMFIQTQTTCQKFLGSKGACC